MYLSRKPTSLYFLAREPSVVVVENSGEREGGEAEKKEAEKEKNED